MVVGGLEHQFYFPMNLGLLIIPIDELIFFRGVAQKPPTSYGQWHCLTQITAFMVSWSPEAAKIIQDISADPQVGAWAPKCLKQVPKIGGWDGRTVGCETELL